MKVNIKLYTVKTEDGKEYWIEGKSIKEVSKKCNVNIKNVSIGADILHLPYFRYKDTPLGKTLLKKFMVT